MANKASPRVLIIGAGMAGLSAASTLISAGVSQVRLYEARDRIGGRIHTVPHAGSFIERGAQWVHGETNRVYQIAKKHGLLLREEEEEEEEGSDPLDPTFAMLRTQNGEKVSIETFAETAEFLGSLIEDYGKEQGGSDNKTPQSIGAFLNDKFHEHLNTSGYSTEDIKIKEAIYKIVLLTFNLLNATSSLNDLSPEAFTAYDEGEGNQMVVLKHGYMSVCEVVREPIPEAAIHLNTAVTKILWDQGECCSVRGKSEETHTQEEEEGNSHPLAAPVAIETSDGSQIRADHIICTIPIGVLKTEASQLFDPPLPIQTTKAIDDIGFGTVNKIFLEWDKPWWNGENYKRIVFLWREDVPFELECIKKEDNLYYKRNLGKEWFRQLTFVSLPMQPNMLLGILPGDSALTFESIPDEEVLDVCTELFRRFTADSSIPRPSKLLRSCWGSDIYSRGAYSYRAIGGDPEECNILSAPIPSFEDPKLQFAGEGATAAYMSTVHGALESGQNAAKNILTRYNLQPKEESRN